MGFFSSGDKPQKRELKCGLGIMPSYRFTADNRFLEGYGNYGNRLFRVALTDIDGVSVDQGSWGKSDLKIMGKGNVLAKVNLATPWSEKAQEFVMDEIERNKAS
jgi:hypothetical protein